VRVRAPHSYDQLSPKLRSLSCITRWNTGFLKCRTHEDAAKALLATGDNRILEASQYDYRWGCGRDGRGNNAYGKILMAVRDKLRELPGEG
jgi:predicted NAD-dependent protein-ADP-ribosyltransferase YbiA (DUF1768 family)